MLLLKKLIFAPFFLISFIFLLYQFRPFLGSTEFVFTLSLNDFYNLLGISALILLSSFLFCLFCVLAASWMFVLPVIMLASSSAFFVFGLNLTIAFFVLSFISFLLIFLSILMELKNYTDFKPSVLFSSPVKLISTLLIFAFAVIYFLSITPIISKNGFVIPDSLIETAMKLMPQETPTKTTQETTLQLGQFQVTPEQLKMLKLNPELLKQYNIDPKMLDNLGGGKNQKPQTVAELSQDFVKKTLQDQFNNILKPYLSFVPIILSVFIFITFQSLVSLLSFLIPPLFWITFLIFEKTKFVNFTEEMRPVKKMVI